MTKKRLSVSVDAELVEAAHAAVAAGRAENVSAWVNEALKKHSEHERGLAAMAEYLEYYQSQYGRITPEDIEKSKREMKKRTITVTGRKGAKSRGAA